MDAIAKRHWNKGQCPQLLEKDTSKHVIFTLNVTLGTSTGLQTVKASELSWKAIRHTVINFFEDLLLNISPTDLPPTARWPNVFGVPHLGLTSVCWNRQTKQCCPERLKINHRSINIIRAKLCNTRWKCFVIKSLMRLKFSSELYLSDLLVCFNLKRENL